MKKVKLLSIILTIVMAVSVIAPIAVSAEQDPLYISARDGDLVYTANFNDTALEWYNDVEAGSTTTTISADGKSFTVSHPETACKGFYGPKLTQYEFPGNVYTLEFWCEVSDGASTRIGTRLVRATDGATYGFFTQKDEYYASVKGLRNGTAQSALDGDLWRFHEGEKNRQYFRVVIDGTTGTMTFYAKEAENNHDYKYMGKYESIPNTPNETEPSYITLCLWLWDVGTISIGDVNLYKGNIMPAVEETTEEETTAEVTTAEVTTAAEITTAEVTTAEETTAAAADDTTAAAEVTTAAPAAKSGCGSVASCAVVALVATLGCAVVFKKH